ncbi:MAG: aminotransferase class V-fold PLP-dependent enzyme [Lysobacterales bacterium]
MAKALSAFELPPDLLYLNSAGQTPRLRAGLAAGAESLQLSAQPWRVSMDAWLARPERVRTLVAELLRCDAQTLALVPSVAYGTAVSAQQLQPQAGQTVLALADEHPSGLHVWQAQPAQLRLIRRNPPESWTEALLAAMDDQFAVVVVPACHWHDGSLLDLERVAAAARARGAALVVDATQALGVIDLDLRTLDADFAVAAGHKWLLGAPGLAYLYVAERHQGGQPLEHSAWSRVGGLAAAIVEDVPPALICGAARFDGSGIYSHPALAMAEVGLAQLQAWGIAAVRDRLGCWQDELLDALSTARLDHWTVTAEAPHLTAVRAPGADAAQSQALAQALLDQGIVVAARGAGIRVSPHLHNSSADAWRLAQALGPAWDRLRG